MEVKPVAWLHTLHMELGQTDNVLSECDDPRRAHGLPGQDYSPAYTVTTTPLYTEAALAARDAENKAKDKALKWIADRAAKLRAGTDDWFELVEFENIARAALAGEKP